MSEYLQSDLIVLMCPSSRLSRGPAGVLVGRLRADRARRVRPRLLEVQTQIAQSRWVQRKHTCLQVIDCRLSHTLFFLKRKQSSVKVCQLIGNTYVRTSSATTVRHSLLWSLFKVTAYLDHTSHCFLYLGFTLPSTEDMNIVSISIPLILI